MLSSLQLLKKYNCLPRTPSGRRSHFIPYPQARGFPAGTRISLQTAVRQQGRPVTGIFAPRGSLVPQSNCHASQAPGVPPEPTRPHGILATHPPSAR